VVLAKGFVSSRRLGPGSLRCLRGLGKGSVEPPVLPGIPGHNAVSTTRRGSAEENLSRVKGPEANSPARGCREPSAPKEPQDPAPRDPGGISHIPRLHGPRRRLSRVPGGSPEEFGLPGHGVLGRRSGVRGFRQPHEGLATIVCLLAPVLGEVFLGEAMIPGATGSRPQGSPAALRRGQGGSTGPCLGRGAEAVEAPRSLGGMNPWLGAWGALDGWLLRYYPVGLGLCQAGLCVPGTRGDAGACLLGQRRRALVPLVSPWGALGLGGRGDLGAAGPAVASAPRCSWRLGTPGLLGS